MICMKKSNKWVLLIAGCFVGFLFWGVHKVNYLGADSIEKARMDTERLLKVYERTGDPKELRQWIISYHGEAPSHQVMMTLSEWSLKHPQQFILLIEGISPDEQIKFAERFGYALADTDRDQAFEQVFSSYKSKAIKSLLNSIPELVPWPDS